MLPQLADFYCLLATYPALPEVGGYSEVVEREDQVEVEAMVIVVTAAPSLLVIFRST